MNPKQLLDHFDRISDAPDALPKLRQFILDLAVRGKLVEQDTKDEPAAALLQRIESEKSILISVGAVRKQKSSLSIDESALPFDIPKIWKWSQLAQIGTVNPRNNPSDDIVASFVPMTLISSSYGMPHEHEVRQWSEIKSGYTHFAEGDVGLAKITPCFENGKSTVFRGLTGGIGAGTTELHVLRPILVRPDYILIFLKSPYFIETGIPKMTGTAGQKRVSTEYFASVPFPLPPLCEQDRIVARVDELMGLCDRLEAAQKERETWRDRLAAASLNRLNNPDPEVPAFHNHVRFHLRHLPRLTTRPDQISALRQTILNLAVRGELVALNPASEDVDLLLGRVEAERRTIEKQSIKSKSSSEKGDLIGSELPNHWRLRPLGELLIFGPTNGISPKAVDYETPVRSLTLSATTSGKFRDEFFKYIPIEVPSDSDLWLRDGDILVQRGNTPEYVGVPAVYRLSITHNSVYSYLLIQG